ncbi:MAG: hypothetical protein LBR18_03285 [Tannerella sp.]|nr:hypothetical protein [Tannerella sp.]
MKQRIYIDTSVVGGYFDSEFAEPTQALFERLKNGEVVFVVSDLLFTELENAPERVKNLLNDYDDDCLERVSITDEVKELANQYIAEGVVGHTSLDDCRHIAAATFFRVDVLASWNFRHIVNLTRIRGYNGVNIKHGYPIIEIRNPKDLMIYGNEQ